METCNSRPLSVAPSAYGNDFADKIDALRGKNTYIMEISSLINQKDYMARRRIAWSDPEEAALFYLSLK